MNCTPESEAIGSLHMWCNLEEIQSLVEVNCGRGVLVLPGNEVEEGADGRAGRRKLREHSSF